MNNYTTARLPLRQSENSELLRQRIMGENQPDEMSFDNELSEMFETLDPPAQK